MLLGLFITHLRSICGLWLIGLTLKKTSKTDNTELQKQPNMVDKYRKVRDFQRLSNRSLSAILKTVLIVA